MVVYVFFVRVPDPEGVGYDHYLPYTASTPKKLYEMAEKLGIAHLTHHIEETIGTWNVEDRTEPFTYSISEQIWVFVSEMDALVKALPN